MMEGFLNWGIQSAILLMIGSIGYFLKQNSAKIDERFERNECCIEKVDEKVEALEGKIETKFEVLEEKLSNLKEELPKEYVIRDDFIRAMSNVDQKLDKIYDIITSKKGGE